MLIESVPFTSVGKLQPFLITVNSSALLLADFHCHLTVREVCGYLGGTWDMNTHSESGSACDLYCIGIFYMFCHFSSIHHKDISLSQHAL